MTTLTPAAMWLNTFFASFDRAILEACSNFANACNYALNPLFEVIGKIGEFGIAFILFGAVLLFFKSTRKAGICVLLALAIGAIFTNLVLKDVVARPRPYITSSLYYSWWNSAGAYTNSDLSFPSGHVTAAAAAMTAWFLSRKSGKAFICALAVVLIMCTDRLYLIVHYPSDVLAGLIVGIIAGTLAYLLVSKISAKYPKDPSKKV